MDHLLRNGVGVDCHPFCADLVNRSVLGVDRDELHSLERASRLGAVNDLANDRITAIQVRLLAVCDKKLVSRTDAPASDSCSAHCSPSRQRRAH